MSAPEATASGNHPTSQATDHNGSILLNPGGADPAAHEPSRRTFTVSQVAVPQYHLANPGPLGLLSFAITTFVLGLYECGAG